MPWIATLRCNPKGYNYHWNPNHLLPSTSKIICYPALQPPNILTIYLVKFHRDLTNRPIFPKWWWKVRSIPLIWPDLYKEGGFILRIPTIGIRFLPLEIRPQLPPGSFRLQVLRAHLRPKDHLTGGCITSAARWRIQQRWSYFRGHHTLESFKKWIFIYQKIAWHYTYV